MVDPKLHGTAQNFVKKSINLVNQLLIVVRSSRLLACALMSGTRKGGRLCGATRSQWAMGMVLM